jgi:hypothetical protein
VVGVQSGGTVSRRACSPTVWLLQMARLAQGDCVEEQVPRQEAYTFLIVDRFELRCSLRFALIYKKMR